MSKFWVASMGMGDNPFFNAIRTKKPKTDFLLFKLRKKSEFCTFF